MKIECDTYDFAERLTDLRIQKGVSARDKIGRASCRERV